MEDGSCRARRPFWRAPDASEWRNLRPIEHRQQFALVGAEPGEQPVEGDKPGLAREDAVEARPQDSPALSARILPIGFEIAIERPDQSTNSGLGLALIIGEGIELVNEPLGMNPKLSRRQRRSRQNWKSCPRGALTVAPTRVKLAPSLGFFVFLGVSWVFP